MKWVVRKYLKSLQKMSKNKFIDLYADNEAIGRICHLVYAAHSPDFNPTNAVILNVSPDYSSIVAQRMAHQMSHAGELMDVVNVDVPYPDELDVLYKQEFFLTLRHLKQSKRKYILVEAAVLSGNNYTWITEMMIAEGIDPKDIITTAAFERYDSIFKCQYVGEVFYEDMIEFYYERYNRHWD